MSKGLDWCLLKFGSLGLSCCEVEGSNVSGAGQLAFGICLNLPKLFCRALTKLMLGSIIRTHKKVGKTRPLNPKPRLTWGVGFFRLASFGSLRLRLGSAGLWLETLMATLIEILVDPLRSSYRNPYIYLFNEL